MNKYGIKMTSQFKRDLKLAKKRGCDISQLESVVEMIAAVVCFAAAGTKYSSLENTI